VLITWVISVGGKALRISVDHTADTPEEVARVQSVGGNVILGLLVDPRDGEPDLKVTRGLGNFKLEPGFTCQPNISEAIDLSTASTEFIILASDGLWDKVSDQEAVSWARYKFSNVSYDPS
jgi:serine/threonine protein phosphatase PrpC